MKAFPSKMIGRLLQQEIDQERIPGAVLHVSCQGKMLMQEAFGYRSVLPNRLPMLDDTVFDLASLTKVVATLPAALKLMEHGQLSLDDPVDYYLPQFGRTHGQKVRIIHLLTHTSGLHADLTDLTTLLTKDRILQQIYQAELLHSPGQKVIYSDLGIILLYQIIQEITDKPFDLFVRKELFEPLEMHETVFTPPFERFRYAATEYCPIRGSYKMGIVHDEKADGMGGVSGHAGLFSTARDLARYALMWEQAGTYKGREILSKAAVRAARRNYTAFDREHRGLGWLLKNPAVPSSCGDFMSEGSYGHTGFTGTSIWFDPEVQLHVILLTNRVHFGRTDHILRLRPRLHNLIRSCF